MVSPFTCLLWNFLISRQDHHAVPGSCTPTDTALEPPPIANLVWVCIGAHVCMCVCDCVCVEQWEGNCAQQQLRVGQLPLVCRQQRQQPPTLHGDHFTHSAALLSRVCTNCTSCQPGAPSTLLLLLLLFSVLASLHQGSTQKCWRGP